MVDYGVSQLLRKEPVMEAIQGHLKGCRKLSANELNEQFGRYRLGM